MKVLHLTLKKRWFDMVASGEKKEEYREIKPHWIARLVAGIEQPRQWEIDEGFAFEWPVGSGCIHSMQSAIHYDVVQFRNGYAKNARTIRVKVKDIIQGYGQEKWGAECNHPYFVIKLGDRLASDAATI